MPTFGPVVTDEHLRAVLELQGLNLPGSITAHEAKEQGFLTVSHSFDLLKEMNAPFPHAGAWVNEELAGYALVMEQRHRNRIPVLRPMFDLLDSLKIQDEPLTAIRYFVMGQICVAKAHRGKGIVKGMYEDLKKRLCPHFDYIITEIATRNTRSMRAHQKIGFKSIHTYTSPEGEEWDVVAWRISD